MTVIECSKLRGIDYLFFLNIAGLLFSAFATDIAYSTDPSGSIIAILAYTLNGCAAIGVINQIAYFQFLLRNPERADRVTQLIHFNLAAIRHVALSAVLCNLSFASIFEFRNATDYVILIFNSYYFIFDYFYARSYAHRHIEAVLLEEESIPLAQNRAISLTVVSSNLLPFSWLVYAVTFIPLYWML